MVDDVLGIGGIELLQDGHDDSTIGDGAHEGDDPVGDVLADEGDAVTGLDIAVLEQQVQFGDIARKIAIGQLFASIVVG